MTKFWVDEAGALIRATDDGVTELEGAAGFTTDENPPEDGRQILIAGVWTARPTADDVKAEARRRIVAIADPDRQRNLTARGTEFALMLAQGEALTVDDLAEIAAGNAIWSRIKALRAASNDIEALDPIPADFTKNTYWPE